MSFSIQQTLLIGGILGSNLLGKVILLSLQEWSILHYIGMALLNNLTKVRLTC